MTEYAKQENIPDAVIYDDAEVKYQSEAKQAGAPLSKKLRLQFQSQMLQHVEKLRSQMDTPFDELYHKEKKLIADIVDAQRALKTKERTLPDAMNEYEAPAQAAGLESEEEDFESFEKRAKLESGT